MQITNQIIMDFFGDDDVINEMLRPANPDYIDNNDESEDDEDYESDDDEDESDDDESEDESEDDEEDLHQFYRNEAQTMSANELIDNLSEIVYESDSDTDVLDNENVLPLPMLTRERPSDYSNLSEIVYESDSDTDNENVLPPPILRRERPSDYGIYETDFLVLPPPALRRERPSDYLTPHTRFVRVAPNAPLANRQLLRDITNIMPRRLAFN